MTVLPASVLVETVNTLFDEINQQLEILLLKCSLVRFKFEHVLLVRTYDMFEIALSLGYVKSVVRVFFFIS